MLHIPKPQKDSFYQGERTELLSKAEEEEKEAIAHYLGEIEKYQQFVTDLLEAGKLKQLIEDLDLKLNRADFPVLEEVKESFAAISPQTEDPIEGVAALIKEFARLFPQTKQLQSRLKRLGKQLESKEDHLDLAALIFELAEKLDTKITAYGKFTFYKNTQLVAELQQNFFLKCAYCESSFVHVSPADIEHFRPKSAVKIDEKTGKEKVMELKPGYYWLAADWDNLLLSCIDCNRRRNQEIFGEEGKASSGKATIFPLENEDLRVRDHETWRKNGPAVAIEEKNRLLLHPCLDDPADHIHFTLERDEEERLIGVFAKPLNNSKKGQKSINVYGLNRAGLIWARTREALHLQNDFFALIVSIKGYLRMRKMGKELSVLQKELENVANPSVQNRLKKLTHNLLQDAADNQINALQDIETAIEHIIEKLAPTQPYLAMKRDIIRHDIQKWSPMAEMIEIGFMTPEHFDQLLQKIEPAALTQALAARKKESP